MEFALLKARKGQISIEFVLLLVILLIYIQMMVQPNLDFAIDSTTEVNDMGLARNATQKLIDTTDYIALSTSNAKQQIHFFLPANTAIICDEAENTLTFEVELKRAYVDPTKEDFEQPCQERDDPDRGITVWVCSKDLSVIDVASLNCTAFGRDSTIAPGPNRGRYYTASIYKDDAGVTHVEA
jgi:uncharacterized protein (UPF0333 family)